LGLRSTKGRSLPKYTYDASGRLLSRWSAAKGTTYYTNDAVGNLTYVKYPSSTSRGENIAGTKASLRNARSGIVAPKPETAIGLQGHRLKKSSPDPDPIRCRANLNRL
jgi:YD repeat-containing protein